MLLQTIMYHTQVGHYISCVFLKLTCWLTDSFQRGDSEVGTRRRRTSRHRTTAQHAHLQSRVRQRRNLLRNSSSTNMYLHHRWPMVRSPLVASEELQYDACEQTFDGIDSCAHSTVVKYWAVVVIKMLIDWKSSLTLSNLREIWRCVLSDDWTYTWMKRGFNACQMHCSMYPSVFNPFAVIQPVSSKVRHLFFCTFWPPLGTPLGQSR